MAASESPDSTTTTTTTTPTPTQTPTHYAIELYFDPALENQVLKSWNVFARRQITSHLIQISARPHLTLLALPIHSLPDPLSLLPPLRSLASRFLDPLPLTLSSVSAYSSSTSNNSSKEGVLFLSPTPSVSLLGLQAQVVEVIRRELGVEVGEEFAEGRWVPGCSVAEGVARGRMAEGFSVLREMRLPVSGYAVDIGLVEVEPVREIFCVPLGGGGGASGGAEN